MDLTRIILLGQRVDKLRQEKLLSTVNFWESSIIIWDLDGLREELEGSRRKPARLVDTKVINVLNQRLQKLDEWVCDGHALIVLVSEFLRFGYDVGGRKQTFTLTTTPLLKDIVFELARGNMVDYCGPQPAKEFFAPYIDRLQYNAVLEANDLVRLLCVKRASVGRPQTVGGYRKHGAGHVIVMPRLSNGGDDISDYLVALASFAESFREKKRTCQSGQPKSGRRAKVFPERVSHNWKPILLPNNARSTAKGRFLQKQQTLNS